MPGIVDVPLILLCGGGTSPTKDEPGVPLSIERIPSGAMLVASFPQTVQLGAFVRFEYRGEGDLEIAVGLRRPGSSAFEPLARETLPLPEHGHGAIVRFLPITWVCDRPGLYRFELWLGGTEQTHFTLPCVFAMTSPSAPTEGLH